MKIAICTVALYDPPLPEKANYIGFTDALKMTYCQKYGYAYLKGTDNPHPGRDPHFCKFAILAFALDKGFDWAIWMDCDAAPVNMNYDIADYLKTVDGKIVMDTDILGFNSGVFAVPNNQKARDWLVTMDSEEMYNVFKDFAFTDQDEMAASFTSPQVSHGKFNDFWVNPPREIGFNDFENIYKWYEEKDWPNKYRRGKSWVLHIAGYGDVYRKNRFRVEYQNLILEHCPVCNCITAEKFKVPFDKTFDPMPPDYPKTGGEVAYHICPHCGTIYAPEFRNWTQEQYKEKIYNEVWEKYVDQNFNSDKRASELFRMFVKPIVEGLEVVLDYGGGTGLFTKKLSALGLTAVTYDPYYGDGKPLDMNRSYSLVTSFECLEHNIHPHEFFHIANKVLVPGGSLITSTQRVNDNPDNEGKKPEEYRNIAPRNGHIISYTDHAFEILAVKHGFIYERETSNASFQLFRKVEEDRD